MSTSLHPLEQKILAALSQGGPTPFDALVNATALNEDQVRRALQWLSSKRLVVIAETMQSKIEVARRPPELELFQRVAASPAPLALDDLKAGFSAEEFSAALGRARRAGWVKVEGEPTPSVRVVDSAGPEKLGALLEAISTGKEEQTLPVDQASLLPDLLRRGVVRRMESRSTTIGITEAGKASATVSEQGDQIQRLTPEILASGGWRGRTLRPIDVEARAPQFYPGRRHPVRDFIREVREAYVSMGFTELVGDSVQPAFWYLVALFIPQDHPGRDMQDTFYHEGLSEAMMKREGVVANVASTHENGWKTGSRGWGYAWDVEEARRLVLRTHNTVLSVRSLSDEGERGRRVFAVS